MGKGVRMRARRHSLVGRSGIVLTMVAVVGCQIHPTFTTGYTVPAAVQAGPRTERRLAVKRFEEGRPPRYYSTQGRAFLTYVPLLPYVSLPYERLDESVNILRGDIVKYGSHADMPTAPPLKTYAYPGSFARAIAEDLAASGPFTTVDYVDDGDTSGYGYVLEGQVRASPLRSTATSFGLGMAGVLLWLLPVPMQKTTAGVVVDLELRDQRSGDIVWRESLESEVARVATIYNAPIIYGSAGSFSFNLLPLQSSVTTVDRDSLFSWHFESLRRAMEKVKPDLARAVTN